MHDHQLASTRRSRRWVLAAFAAAVATPLAGCAAPAPDATTAAAPEVEADPLQADLAGQQRLLAAYTQTMAAFPSLRPRLAPLAQDHAAQVAALARAVGAVVGGAPRPLPRLSPLPVAALVATGSPGATAGGPATPGAPTPAPSRTGTPRPTGTPSPTATPSTPGAALAALRRQEESTAAARAAAAIRLTGPRAALLGSISASCSCHATVLGWWG